MDFWDRLDTEILKKGKTRKAVAKDIGFNVGNFASWKARTDYPNAKRACEIAKHLDTTVEYLVTGVSAARWVPPDKLKPIVEDLEVLNDNELATVATMIHGVAVKHLDGRRASGDG